MSSIEQLITPQYVYSNIVEHMRSQLNVKELYSSELRNLEITEVQISAFKTRYNFYIERAVTEETTSSLLLLPEKASKSVEKAVHKYVGYVEEILEPGADHPIFEFRMERITE